MAPTTRRRPSTPHKRARPGGDPRATRPRRILLGRRLSHMEEVRAVEAGVPVTLVRDIQREAHLTLDALSKALGIPRRTLINHLKHKHLDTDEGDRVLRLKRILEQATDTFDGDRDAALAWFKTGNRALGGIAPIDLVATGTGARAVENVLGRMEHGLFS